MASNHTTNYQLNQWEKTDRILMDDFNADNEKIDAALGRLEQNLNCRVALGTYTGDGNTERSITFDGTPLAVYLQGAQAAGSAFLLRGSPIGGLIAEADKLILAASRVNVTWTGSTVKWSRHYSEHTATSILNGNKLTYRYIALLAVGEVPGIN